MMKKKRKPKERERKKRVVFVRNVPSIKAKAEGSSLFDFFFCLSLFLQQLSNFQTLLCVRFKPSSPRTQPLGNRNAYIKREGKKNDQTTFSSSSPPSIQLRYYTLGRQKCFRGAILFRYSCFFPLLLHAALVSSVVECRLYSSRAVPRFLVI